jgi:hypothetical protein
MVTEIELCECPVLTALDFCLWGWNKSDVYKTNVDPPDELLARTLHSAARNVKINSEERHTISSHKMQSALRLTVGFSNVFFLKSNRFVI